MPIVLPSPKTLNKLQRTFGRRNRYTGPLTGVVNEKFIKAIQTQLEFKGVYTGPIDGNFNTDTAKGIQKYARQQGTHVASIDGVLTEDLWKVYLQGNREVNQFLGDQDYAAPVLLNTTAPAVTGTTTTGSTLTTTNGTWASSPTSYTYIWKRDGALISGATASTYVLTPADALHAITAVVFPVLSGFGPSPATSNTVNATKASFSNSTAPAVTGTAKVGSTLTVSNGAWTQSPDSYSYVWKKAGTVITGATAATYIPVTGDIGSTLTAEVTAIKAGYNNTTTASTATAAVIA